MRISKRLRGLQIFAALLLLDVGCTVEIYDQHLGVVQCGNGLLEPGEACDDGGTVSSDGCSRTCSLEVCGNGLRDPGEACDDGGTVSGDGCSRTCFLEVCGNGIVDPGERCDDGNTISGDYCSADCWSDGTCGNLYLDIGEVCDSGGASAFCDPDCTFPQCGDGLVNPAAGEQCDDGNMINGDGCESDCTVTP